MPPSNATTPRLSVILPGYNERPALPNAVTTYREALRECHLEEFELIIVDDGSTDGMGELADEIARDDSRIRVIHHPRNLGQVTGILNGFREARGDILTHNGMDLGFDPQNSGQAMSCFDNGADIVVVERTHRKAYGVVRKTISWCNSLLVCLLFDTPFRDHNFVQFFRREVIESVPVLSTGVSTVTTELILRARRRGYHVVGIKAKYHARQSGKSTITIGKILHTTIETLKLWWLMRLPERAAVDRAAARSGCGSSGAEPFTNETR